MASQVLRPRPRLAWLVTAAMLLTACGTSPPAPSPTPAAAPTGAAPTLAPPSLGRPDAPVAIIEYGDYN